MRTTFQSLLRVYLVCLLLGGLVLPAGADEQEIFPQLLEKRGPALVTIKCVLKMKTGRGDQEMESENTGVMIDPKGLVLCSNTKLSGPVGVVKRVMGSSAAGVSVTPADIKVLVGDAADGLDARFIARDTELDLAWIEIKEPGDKKFAYVDLAKSVQPKIGQQVFSVYRMSKHYDRTLIVSQHRIGGIAHKPRELFIGEDFSESFGLPAYSATGDVVGVVVLQMPEDDETTGQMAMLNRMANANEMNGALLPAAEVLKATTRAKESAATQPAEDATDSAPTTRPAKKEDAE